MATTLNNDKQINTNRKALFFGLFIASLPFYIDVLLPNGIISESISFIVTIFCFPIAAIFFSTSLLQSQKDTNIWNKWCNYALMGLFLLVHTLFSISYVYYLFEKGKCEMGNKDTDILRCYQDLHKGKVIYDVFSSIFK